MFAIPDSEYKDRMKRFQKNIREAGLDAALVHANEADFANVRYLSEYWPTFESAGVFVPATGAPTLIIGPESEAYAKTRSKIRRIALMVEYRESAEPEYPGIPVAHYPDIVAKAMHGKKLKRLGLVGYSVMPLPVYTSLSQELPGVQLIKADDTLISLRVNKSPNEIKLMKKAFNVSEKAIEAILKEIKPGMTELQVIGIAQREIYAHGGEYEGHALYCFCGPATKHAISRPTHNTIKRNEVIQINIGARVGGYSSSVGLPICIGKLPARKKRLVEFGLEAHLKTMELMKAGKPAADVVKEYEDFVTARGFRKHMLYGPCHGIGMMEVERPWMESTSTYVLKEDMTFQVDTFFYDTDFGLRWENGVCVGKRGVKRFSQKFMRVVEL
ncbi:MAG TPA: Xaa-Pro peptidase family protein [Candidatus Hydrogenedentes bacterium]|nr:Xaa-Pro peptidase family protein [Candidatus Hydrogenedentota bacterium]HPG67030.1 Xaa-Pro peptidase family protein [Candidatus Hydrogenedentota bacterium]